MAKAARNSLITRRRLHAAALRSGSDPRAESSVRSIAKEAGITGAALYRHYAGLEELYGAVFEELILPMIAEKRNLVAMRSPFGDRLREWVRCSYACFDREPAAFAYVFLIDRPLPKRFERLSGEQGRLFGEMLAQGRAEGALRIEVEPTLATAFFIALLLCVPERIRSGKLKGPALRHVDEVARAARLLLAKDPCDAAEPERRTKQRAKS